MGGDAFVEEGEEAVALFGAGGGDAPHAFVVALTDVAAGALCDAAVDDAVADLLFAVVVGRLNKVRRTHEAEVVFGLVVGLQFAIVILVVDGRKTGGEFFRIGNRWRLEYQFHEVVSMATHCPIERCFRHLVASMPRSKHPLGLLQKLLGPADHLSVRMGEQKPNVADQVCPTKLRPDVVVPRERAVGRKVIGVEKALETRADKLLEYFRTTTLCDVKQRQVLRA